MPYLDPEKRHAYGREWMKRNPEKAREAMRRWRARHPNEHKRARDGYDAAHPESANARRKRYRQRHPEVRRVIDQLRRARVAGAGGKYTAREWADLVLSYQGKCAYDGASGPLQPDHRVPLALGGFNEIENILPACGRCNRRKHLMSEADFRARLARESQIGESPAF
jgi:5-methylcytosine-specific restriction endonuclease McrA